MSVKIFLFSKTLLKIVSEKWLFLQTKWTAAFRVCSMKCISLIPGINLKEIKNKKDWFVNLFTNVDKRYSIIGYMLGFPHQSDSPIFFFNR